MAELKNELRIEISKLNGGPGLADSGYEKPTKVSSSPLKNPSKSTKNQKPTKHNQKKPKSHTKNKNPKKPKTHKTPKKPKTKKDTTICMSGQITYRSQLSAGIRKSDVTCEFTFSECQFLPFPPRQH